MSPPDPWAEAIAVGERLLGVQTEAHGPSGRSMVAWPRERQARAEALATRLARVVELLDPTIDGAKDAANVALMDVVCQSSTSAKTLLTHLGAVVVRQIYEVAGEAHAELRAGHSTDACMPLIGRSRDSLSLAQGLAVATAGAWPVVGARLVYPHLPQTGKMYLQALGFDPWPETTWSLDVVLALALAAGH